MSLNVVYCLSNQADWMTVALNLYQELDWNPKYWVTRHNADYEPSEHFSDLILHPRLDLNRGIPAQQVKHLMLGSLSKDELERANNYIAMALNILDRVDLGRSFSYQERMRLIHKLLIYWGGVIKTLEIDVAVFSAPPHAIGEYLLYSSMKLAGRQVRIFRSTSLNHLHFIADAVETLPTSLLNAYQTSLTDNSIKCSKTIMDGISELTEASDEYKPWYVHDVTQREENYSKISEKIIDAFEKEEIIIEPFNPEKLIQKFDATPVMALNARASDNDAMPRTFKLPGRPISAPFLTRVEFRKYRQWAMLQKLLNKRQYESLCVDYLVDCPYIYFAMHYQPERTTYPDGGVFGDQFLAISLIAEAMPKGWTLYVKEHPSQFRYNALGEMSRWVQYYDDIAALPNVKLVPITTASIRLIDGAKAVATITGAVGWESLVRGKPVLCFGNPWYGACKGSFILQNKMDAHNAIQKIVEGYLPKIDDVLAYAAAIESVSLPVMTTPTVKKAFSLDVNLAESLTCLIAQYENNYKYKDKAR